MPKRFIVPVVLLGLFIAYIVFQSRAFLFPPSLIIYSPLAITVKAGQEITIRGKTFGQSRAYINGEEIFLDKQGMFSQEMVIEAGLRAIQVKAINRFGKENVKTTRVIN